MTRQRRGSPIGGVPGHAVWVTARGIELLPYGTIGAAPMTIADTERLIELLNGGIGARRAVMARRATTNKRRPARPRRLLRTAG